MVRKARWHGGRGGLKSGSVKTDRVGFKLLIKFSDNFHHKYLSMFTLKGFMIFVKDTGEIVIQSLFYNKIVTTIIIFTWMQAYCQNKLNSCVLVLFFNFLVV